MALSATLVSKYEGAHGQHAPKLAVVDVTIGATTDYTVGTGFPGLVALIEQTAKLSVAGIVHVAMRSSGGAPRLPLWYPTGNSNGVRLYEARAAGLPFAEDEIEQADISANDVLRVTLLGV